MLFLITYQSQLGSNERIEWVCPGNYTAQDAIESFKRQWPTSTLISILQLQQ